MKELTEQQVLFKLAAYCSKGERSLFDLHKKMDQWEFPQAKRKEVIDRLIREHFVDEERYCRAFVRDKTLYANSSKKSSLSRKKTEVWKSNFFPSCWQKTKVSRQQTITNVATN